MAVLLATKDKLRRQQMPISKEIEDYMAKLTPTEKLRFIQRVRALKRQNTTQQTMQPTSLTVSRTELDKLESEGKVLYFEKIPEGCLCGGPVSPYWLTPSVLASDIKAFLVSSDGKHTPLEISPQ